MVVIDQCSYSHSRQSSFHLFCRVLLLEIKQKRLSCSVLQVDIEINGTPVSLQMKLGENGEAFFVEETENTLVGQD